MVGAAAARGARGSRLTGSCARARSGSDRNTTEVREAQRHAEYFYRLAVDPPASKELRLFGLATWVVDRFRARRRHLLELQWQATRLRERPVLWCLLIVSAANAVFFWSMASRALDGTLTLDRAITFATAAVTTSAIAFGGFGWALDGAAAPAGAVVRLERAMDPAGALVPGVEPAAGRPAREIRFRERDLCLPVGWRRRAPGFRPDDPRRLVARDRRQERCRQDDAREAALPSLRPAGGRH